MSGENPPVTVLLRAWRDGDEGALGRLIPLVYDELRRLAAGYLQSESAAETLQPTALVHEAYLRLAGRAEPDFADRIHFRCVAASIMRSVLIDRARARNSDKRNAGAKVELTDETAFTGERAAALLALDDALAGLQRVDEEKARILELKYFGGLTAEETAEFLGLSLNQVNWQIRTAQAWLRREMDIFSSSRHTSEHNN